MKKLVLAFGLGLFLLASCKKDYTCTCTGYVDGEVAGSSSSIVNGTKSDVKEACDAGDQPEVLGVSVNCEIQ